MAKEGKYATLRLPSGEMRMVPLVCRASIGVVGNGDHNLVNLGKAGRKRRADRQEFSGRSGPGHRATGRNRPSPCTCRP